MNSETERRPCLIRTVFLSSWCGWLRAQKHCPHLQHQHHLLCCVAAHQRPPICRKRFFFAFCPSEFAAFYFRTAAWYMFVTQLIGIRNLQITIAVQVRLGGQMSFGTLSLCFCDFCFCLSTCFFWLPYSDLQFFDSMMCLFKIYFFCQFWSPDVWPHWIILNAQVTLGGS